jgi:type II secretory pathway predicted ATPase ExeA
MTAESTHGLLPVQTYVQPETRELSSNRPIQAGIGERAFGSDAGEQITLNYQSHRDALKFIQSALKSPRGVAVLHGPRSSGKTTIIHRVRDALPGDTAVALIDGTDIRPHGLLSGMLSQYGYNVDLDSSSELLQMVKVFAMQQAGSGQPPILIVDNIEHMYPSALRTLDTLATLTVKRRFAIRILLTGNENLSSLIGSDSLSVIAKRQLGIFTIGPLSDRETTMYLHAKLAACGVRQPETLFPDAACGRMRELSGGWPGLINHYAQDAICPDRPRLIITRNGETVSQYVSSTNKVLIGRSEFADVVLNDGYASKMHAALLRYSNALVLHDLNSANGTTVNSVRLKSTVLRDDDIISIGHHRLKVENAPAISEEVADRLQSPDTVKMRNLTEMRRLRDELRVVAVAENKRG